nr:uncharacterized protein LOC129383933 [Dermacentor andersoni]
MADPGPAQVTLLTPRSPVRMQISYEDAEDWLEEYERVAKYEWHTGQKLSHVYFSLEDGARTWFVNREGIWPSWEEFRSQFFHTFGSSERVGQTPLTKHRIITEETDGPIRQNPYRAAPKEREAIREQARMLKLSLNVLKKRDNSPASQSPDNRTTTLDATIYGAATSHISQATKCGFGAPSVGEGFQKSYSGGPYKALRHLSNLNYEAIHDRPASSRFRETNASLLVHIDSTCVFFFQDPAVWTPRRKRLKKTAIPSRCLPVRVFDAVDEASTEASRERSLRASARSWASVCTTENGPSNVPLGSCTAQQPNIESSENVPTELESNPVTELDQGAAIALQRLGTALSEATSLERSALDALLALSDRRCRCVGIGIQVCTDSSPTRRNTLVDLLSADAAIKAFTGVETVELLMYLSEAVAKLDTLSTECSVLERVILVLVRLKTFLSFKCLAVLFAISEATVHRYFYGTVRHLAAVLEAAVPWPTAEEIKKIGRIALQHSEMSGFYLTVQRWRSKNRTVPHAVY